MLFYLILSIIAIGLLLTAYNMAFKSKLKIHIIKMLPIPNVMLFNTLCDLKTWNRWSPWAQHDPSAVMTFSDMPASIGGHCSWYSFRAGDGEMTTTRIIQNEHIKQTIKIDYPHKIRFEVNWYFASKGIRLTELTCKISCEVPWHLKWDHKFWKTSIEKYCEYGAETLKDFIDPKTTDYRLEYMLSTKLKKCSYVYHPYKGTIAGLQEILQSKFTDIFFEINYKEGNVVGYPFCLYTKINYKTNMVNCRIAIPVEKHFSLARYKKDSLKALRVQPTKLTGSSEYLPLAWHQAHKHFKVTGLKSKLLITGVETHITDSKKSYTKDAITVINLVF